MELQWRPDDCRGNKARLIAAGKLSATDVQQEVTDISRQLEKVLDSYILASN